MNSEPVTYLMKSIARSLSSHADISVRQSVAPNVPKSLFFSEVTKSQFRSGYVSANVVPSVCEERVIPNAAFPAPNTFENASDHDSDIKSSFM